ncbi:transposable element Tcb2 transposase [Trichonephila clavipes]|nr:transposable element Tcb2 transposase [Trichonephila clavipes]
MSSRHHIDDFMRGRIIGKIEEGRKITDVAREFDIAHSVLSRLWKSFKTTGMCSRRHGGGRVRSKTPAEDRYIVLSAKRNRRTTAQQHRTARLQWCREHHNWTEQNWACVLFSDESRFSLTSDCRRQLIWRESGTAYRPENIQEKDRYPTCSIMVWTGIMINGRTRLHVVANGTMTGQRYIDEVLPPHVRLFRGAVGDKFVFMDDNATCHRTLAVQDCLDSEGIQHLLWPARFPDINPIENVWDALRRQVAGRNYPPTNKNTLIRALTEEWDKLPQQLLDNVVQMGHLYVILPGLMSRLMLCYIAICDPSLAIVQQCIIGNMKSEFVADAWSNFSVSYVYFDLISPQIVGDTKASLLRIVRTKGKDGEMISQYYDRPQYLPLVRHSFQTIQSELRLNSGDFVPFERVKGGKTIGKEVLMTGSRVASDVLSGENFKEAVKTRSRESGKKLAQKAIDRVQSMVGKGQYKRKHSPECVKSELELFNLSGTQTVIQDGQWKQFHPLSNVFDNAPVEFHISGSAEDYIDLSQTQLYVKAKIVKVDNTPITKDDTIGPVNLFLHSLFSQADVSLNDRVVSNSRCVDNEAFHGAFSKSPYEFKHFNLNFIGVYVDGQPVPHNPLELDFSKDQYIRAYQTLFVGTDRMGQDRGILISRKEYKDSNTLFGFNLSPDLCSSGEHLSLIKHSNLRLELKFSKSLEQTVCVIVFAEFENLIEINKSRNILYDFGN